jgi:hypothetical protein
MKDQPDLDDFEFMDAIQDEHERAVNELLPFEPGREVREETAHEERVEAFPADELATVEQDDIIDPLADLDVGVGTDG